MHVTPELLFALFGATATLLGGAFVVGGLIWKGATKLTSIESKVDKALEWIEEQKAVVTSPRKRKAK